MDSNDRNDGGVATAKSILNGRPVYKAFQSRLLGPSVTAGLAKATRQPFKRIYKVVCVALLLFGNILALVLFQKYAGSWEEGAFYTVVYAFLSVGLQARTYVPLWDFIDFLTMMVFAWAVVTRASRRLLIALFVVELLNREVALFIPLWIMIDSVQMSRSDGGRRRLRIDRNALLGFVLMVSGIAWTHFARNWHFKKESFVMPIGIHTIGDQFWMLPRTLTILRIGPKLDSLMAVLMALWIAFVVVTEWKSGIEKRQKLALLLLAMLASILMFGLITETRIWISTIPFLLWISLMNNRERRSAQIERPGEPFPGQPQKV